jgi:hypothetical protein
METKSWILLYVLRDCTSLFSIPGDTYPKSIRATVILTFHFLEKNREKPYPNHSFRAMWTDEEPYNL